MNEDNVFDYDSVMELFDLGIEDGTFSENDSIVKLDDDVIEEQYITDDKVSLTERNKHYNELLKAYVDHIKNSLLFKQSNRKFTFNLFVWVFVVIIITIACLVFGVCWYGVFDDFSVISILITSLITLITSLLIIPTKIAEFIYNPNEDVQIGEIIKNLQDYDKSLRDNLKK